MGNGVDRGEPCSRPTTDYDYDGFLANFSKVGWGMGRCDLMKTRTFERQRQMGNGENVGEHAKTWQPLGHHHRLDLADLSS